MNFVGIASSTWLIIFGPRKSTRVARSPMKAMNVNKVGSQYQTKRKAAVTTPPLTAGYQSHSQPGKTPKARFYGYLYSGKS